MFDERMIAFLAQLAEMHVDPTVSDPCRRESVPDDARAEDEVRLNWDSEDLKQNEPWSGIWKDIGIFTEDEWAKIMCTTLSSMGV